MLGVCIKSLDLEFGFEVWIWEKKLMREQEENIGQGMKKTLGDTSPRQEMMIKSKVDLASVLAVWNL